MDPLLIQRAPAGLLDLLGLKGTGQTPIRLAETVAATLADCVDYYMAPKREHLNGTTPLALVTTGNFSVPSLTVPNGELWLIYNYTVRLAAPTAAGSTMRFWGGFAKSASSSNPVALTETISVGAADIAAACATFTRPLIWMPGDVPVVSTGLVTGAPAVAGNVRLDVAKLTL